MTSLSPRLARKLFNCSSPTNEYSASGPTRCLKETSLSVREDPVNDTACSNRILPNSVSPLPQTNGLSVATGNTFLMDIPEDPPCDGNHPHDNGDHQHDVVHYIATKLAETAGHVIATSLTWRKFTKLLTIFQKWCTWLFLMQRKHLTMAIRRRRRKPMPVPPRINIQGMFGSAGQSGFGSPGATACNIRIVINQRSLQCNVLMSVMIMN